MQGVCQLVYMLEPQSQLLALQAAILRGLLRQFFLGSSSRVRREAQALTWVGVRGTPGGRRTS